MNVSDRDAIRQEIAKAEKKLADLLRQKEETEVELHSLRERLKKGSDQNIHSPSSVSTTRILTPDDKLTLFLRLFRGRSDVYPKLWQNPKSGKKGYSPACANEWVRGVCEKPRVKCVECPNQGFLPVTADVILNHLRGRHVIGVYPMLTDETCWFPAADFDKEAWWEDVFAFTETCRRFSIPYTIERSRSGNGAHVWFFFASPVAAATARGRAVSETTAENRGPVRFHTGGRRAAYSRDRPVHRRRIR